MQRRRGEPLKILSVGFGDKLTQPDGWAVVSDFGGNAEIDQYCGSVGAPVLHVSVVHPGNDGTFRYGADYTKTGEATSARATSSQDTKCGGFFGPDRPMRKPDPSLVGKNGRPSGRPCSLVRPLGGRQFDDEGRAAAEARGLDPDAAVHPTNELATDVEAEPGAADSAGHVRIEPVELLEDAALLGRRDAEAFVGDHEPHDEPAPSIRR